MFYRPTNTITGNMFMTMLKSLMACGNLEKVISLSPRQTCALQHKMVDLKMRLVLQMTLMN